MALATSYTEQELSVLMAAELGDVATVLGWEPGNVDAGSYERAVNRTLRLYGASDIADATDMDKLESIARVAVWEQVTNATVPQYQVILDGQVLTRSQFYEHAKERLGYWTRQAGQHINGSTLRFLSIERASDPYRRSTTSETEFG